MVVIASMISVQGLGLNVLRGIGRLDMGMATISGIGIVLLAIILDRSTQAIGELRGPNRRLVRRGPIGMIYKFFFSIRSRL